MTPFIYPFQANYVRKELKKLLHVVYFVGDYRVYQATKESLQSSMQALFGPLTPDQQSLFTGMTEIKGQRELTEFMDRLRPYVIPFPFHLEEVRRLFKKEKKLTVPDSSQFDWHTMSYFGWRDIGKNHLYLVYPYMGELTGIQARYTTGNATERNVCCICNEGMKGSEIGLVVARTKAALYQSVGNYMCLDSRACNSRITSIHAIEDFFSKALAK